MKNLLNVVVCICLVLFVGPADVDAGLFSRLRCRTAKCSKPARCKPVRVRKSCCKPACEPACPRAACPETSCAPACDSGCGDAVPTEAAAAPADDAIIMESPIDAPVGEAIEGAGEVINESPIDVAPEASAVESDPIQTTGIIIENGGDCCSAGEPIVNGVIMSEGSVSYPADYTIPADSSVVQGEIIQGASLIEGGVIEGGVIEGGVATEGAIIDGGIQGEVIYDSSNVGGIIEGTIVSDTVIESGTTVESPVAVQADAPVETAPAAADAVPEAPAAEDSAPAAEASDDDDKDA